MKLPKPFPLRCSECREREVIPAVVHNYAIDLTYDGQKHHIVVPELNVPVCQVCGAVHIDIAADEQINAAFRDHLRLLSPESITKQRKALGLTQKEFARQLGIAKETVCRWESGMMIQSRANDNLMRLFFDIPDVRSALEALCTAGSSPH